MTENTVRTQTKICPKCGKEYRGVPAISRTDSVTLICPDCGTREALQSIGQDPDEIERIIEILHSVNIADK